MESEGRIQEAKRLSMDSPKKSTHQILGTLSVKEIKPFLLECANLPNPIDYPDHRPYFERWLRRWQRIFMFERETEDGKRKPVQLPRGELERFVPLVRTTLCRIWVERDARQRDWYFYRLRDAYHQMIVQAEDPSLVTVATIASGDGIKRLRELEEMSRHRRDDPIQRARFFRHWMGLDDFQYAPGICPFESAIYWLQANQRLMLHCGGPMCAVPYFFRTERGQKFCSPECADPARREAKLRWWNESPNSPKNRAKKSKAARLDQGRPKN